MPEETPNQPASGFPDVKKNNEDVVSKLNAQDISGQPTTPDVNSGTGDALDALLKDVQGKDDDAEKKAEEERLAAEKKAAEEKAAAEKKAADDADPEKKAAADKAAAEAAAKADAERKRADELFKDSPQLPANASPKSSEAFSSVKIKAAQEISARDQKISDLEAKVKDLEAKANKPLPDEIKRELDDHRNWRTKLDIEADPKFKEYDKKVESVREFVYAQLRKSPKITDAVIEKIKSHGGPENVDMDKLFAAIEDPTTQRLIEAKLAELESIKFDKDQAIKSAQNNVKDYIAQREKAWQESATSHETETSGHLAEIMPKLDYMQRKEIPAGADDATRKSIEAHNKYADEMQATVVSALKDNSPAMRAVMITGVIQSIHLKTQLTAEKARADKAEASLKEANEKLEKLKNASVSRLRESAAPPSGKTPAAKEDPHKFGVPATQALDDIAKQIVEERARASGAGA